MNSNDNLLAMLEVLKLHGVNYTEQFYKDLCKLVKTDVNKFIKDFSRDFSRMSYKKHNRYEELSLNSDQKKRIDGKSLYRYEYRNSSNLRCIYIIEDEYNNIYTLFYGSAVLPVGLFNQSNDFETLYNFIDSELNDGRRQLMFDIIADLTEMRPLDLQKYLNTAFTDANEFAKTPAKTIGEYNKNVATSFGASINKLMSKYNMWRNDLKMRPGYSEFIARLRARLGNQLNMTRFGRGRE